MNLTDSPYCNCLFFSLGALNRRITLLAEEAFSEAGLSPSHSFVLMAVNSKPGIQPGEIAEKMLLSPSTVTRLIEKLENLQLVERKSWGKFIKVEPTSRGLEKDLRIKKAWENLYKRYSAELGDELSKNLVMLIHNAFQKTKIKQQ